MGKSRSTGGGGGGGGCHCSDEVHKQATGLVILFFLITTTTTAMMMMMMMMMTTILVMVTVKKKSRGKRASYRRFQHPREEFTCCPPFRRGSQHNIYILQGYRGRSSLVFFSEALGGWLCDRRAGLKRHILDTIIFPLFRSLIVFVFVFLKKETHKTKRIESNRNETKRNETKRSEAKRNKTKETASGFAAATALAF